jgi:excisionase family DNA binding protein
MKQSRGLMTAYEKMLSGDQGKLLYSAEEAARLLGIGRTLMFHLLATGQIESIKIGRLRKIPHDALIDFIKRQPRRLWRSSCPPFRRGPSLDPGPRRGCRKLDLSCAGRGRHGQSGARSRETPALFQAGAALSCRSLPVRHPRSR